MWGFYLIGLQALGEYLRGLLEEAGLMTPKPPPPPIVVPVPVVPEVLPSWFDVEYYTWDTIETLAIPVLTRVVISMLVTFVSFRVYEMVQEQRRFPVNWQARRVRYSRLVPPGASMLTIATTPITDWNWVLLARRPEPEHRHVIRVERRVMPMAPVNRVERVMPMVPAPTVWTLRTRPLNQADLGIRNNCLICLEEFPLGELIPDIPHACLRTHNFMHKTCLEKWFQTTTRQEGGQSCPMCRQNIGHFLRR